MADKKISQLTAKTSADDTDELLISDAGTSKKITFEHLNDSINLDWDTQISGGNKPEPMADVTKDKLHLMSPLINTTIANQVIVSESFKSIGTTVVKTPEEVLTRIVNEQVNVTKYATSSALLNLNTSTDWDTIGSPDNTVPANRASESLYIHSVPLTQTAMTYSIPINLRNGWAYFNFGGYPDFGDYPPTYGNFVRWLGENYSEVTSVDQMYLTPNASFENLDASENNPGYTKEALDSDRFITPGWNVWLKVTATVDSFTMTIDGITTTTFSTVYEGFSQLAITPATPYVNIDNGVSAFVDDLVAKLGLSAGDISALWAWDAVDNEWHSWVYGTPLFLNSLPTITSGMAIYITNDTATENNYITKHESSFLISTQSAELEAYNSVSSYNAATYFSTSDGSNVLTITHTAHGAFVGGYVTLSGYTPPASPGNAAVNTKYAIKAILDEDTYEVTLPYEATTDTITSSGTLSYTYPPSLKVADIVTDGSGDISTLTTTASNNPLV